MKIIIDDITNSIDTYENGHRDQQIISLYNRNYEFNKVVDDILTASQFSGYIGSDTRRVFILSKKKEEILKNYKKKFDALK